MIEVNSKNYFSKEMNQKYFSVSQYKNFQLCTAKALNDLENDIHEKKEAFLEGQLFESWVAGDRVLFLSKHPEIISSTGKTKGELKANFKKVIKAAERFLEVDLFKNIINKCEKQKILIGEINGVKIKCALDLFDLENTEIFDIKCMSDFKEKWSDKEKCYLPWYYTYNYILQMAIYREIAKQNFSKDFKCNLMAATKEEVPDIEARRISSNLMDLELEIFKKNINYYNDIKTKKIPAVRCEKCDYCKKTKIIKGFEIIE